jgi:hypothetical protein
MMARVESNKSLKWFSTGQIHPVVIFELKITVIYGFIGKIQKNESSNRSKKTTSSRVV